MAKTISRTFFEVKSMDGTSGLAISNMVNESFELTVEAINDAVAGAKAQGYDNDEKWLIVSVFVDKIWDDDGMFLSESQISKAFATYDNGWVSKI